MLKLEELRKNKGISQETLAKDLGMTQQRISAYEKGKREPDIDTLKQLSEYFNCSLDYLLGKSDVRNHKEEKEDPFGLAEIGFSLKDYNPPTEKQKEQIEAMVKIILKDNKKEEGEK